MIIPARYTEVLDNLLRNEQAKAENETAQNNLDQAQKVKEQAEKMLKRL